MPAAWVKDVVAVVPAVDTNNKLVITTGASVAQGDLLVVIGFRYINAAGDTIASVTDSKGNTYVVDVGGQDMGGGQIVGVASGYMTSALTNTDTVTITWTNASAVSYFGGQLTEYSGIATSSWTDKTASTAGFRTQANGITSGATATLAGSNDLVYGLLFVQSGSETISAGSGYTIRSQVTSASVTAVWAPEDKVLSGSTAAQTATGSWVTGNQNEGAICVTYKAAAAGGGVVPQIMNANRQRWN